MNKKHGEKAFLSAAAFVLTLIAAFALSGCANAGGMKKTETDFSETLAEAKTDITADTVEKIPVGWFMYFYNAETQTCYPSSSIDSRSAILYYHYFNVTEDGRYQWYTRSNNFGMFEPVSANVSCGDEISVKLSAAMHYTGEIASGNTFVRIIYMYCDAAGTLTPGEDYAEVLLNGTLGGIAEFSFEGELNGTPARAEFTLEFKFEDELSEAVAILYSEEGTPMKRVKINTDEIANGTLDIDCSGADFVILEKTYRASLKGGHDGLHYGDKYTVHELLECPYPAGAADSALLFYPASNGTTYRISVNAVFNPRDYYPQYI